MKCLPKRHTVPRHASIAIIIAGTIFLLWLAAPSLTAWIEIARHLFPSFAEN